MSGVMPQRALSPASTSVSAPPSDSAAGSSVDSVRLAVSVGTNSRLAGLCTLESVDLGELTQVAIAVPVESVVRNAIAVVAGIEAQKVDTPGLEAGTLRKAKLGQRNLHLHDVSLVVNPPVRVPDGVPGRIFRLAHVVVRQVHLHAIWIRKKLERTLLVAVGIDHDADEVVVESSVAVTQVGAYARRIRVLCVERDVQVVSVLNEVGKGLHLGGDVFARAGLDADLNPARIAPGRLVDAAVDHHGLVRPGHAGRAVRGVRGHSHTYGQRPE